MCNDSSPALLSHGCELCDTAQDLMEEIALRMGPSPKTPFRFTQSSRSQFRCCLSLWHWWAHATYPDNQKHYCVHIRVILGEGRDDQPPPSHAWSWLLITDILQEACPGDWISKAVVLVPGEAILFFGRCSLREGLLCSSAEDVELGLRGPVNWAVRTVQVEAIINTIQEGCQVMMDAVMEKKTMARGLGHPWGSRGATQSSAATCNIDNWMWGLDEGTSDREVGRAGDILAEKYGWDSAHALCVGGGGRWHRWQGTPGVPRCLSGGWPFSVGWSSDCGSNWSSLHSTMMRASSGSLHAGRDLWVKVTLPAFKDEKSKDVVTYYSWWWGVVIFHQSGWDDQHLLPYVFAHCSDSWVI